MTADGTPDDASRSSERRYSVEEYRAMVAGLPKTAKGARRRGGKARPKAPVVEGVLAAIARVLARAPLGRLRLQPEEALAVAFADELRRAVLEGRLRAVWTHPANELAGRRSGLSEIRYAIAKAMGLVHGTPDYLFLASDRSGALEAKTGTGTQQQNQKDYETWCLAVGVPYRVFRSIEEGLAILVDWGMLVEDREQGRAVVAGWEGAGGAD